MSENGYPISDTICWECANATGGCSWSKRLIPVKGWKAIPTTKQTTNSYAVYECPKFKRDAINHGQRRLPKECQEKEKL